jgi:hypothetical protein
VLGEEQIVGYFYHLVDNRLEQTGRMKGVLPLDGPACLPT